ncbi:hypothetical protein Bbelb_334940 [Branchiostoma belcheri]|nr:hypothetical protein Bbelb_334940 [Branchiostoma belcheri]
MADTETNTDGKPETSGDGKSEPTGLERKIYQQMEYYFGDHNLTRDRFLQGEIKKDDGWVPLETLVKFNRLKALSDDFEVICAALQKSPNQLMEVSEDKTKVRRLPSKSLPKNTEQWRSENKARTVYCKGFGQDDSLDDIQEFFQDKGKVETVFMRRNENKDFKGSVFATFSSLDDAKKFVEAEGVQYKGEDVKKMFNRQKPCDKSHWVCGAPDDTVREEVSKVFQTFGDVKWIDFNKGDTQGTVRFASPGAAEAAAQVADGKVTLKGAELSCRVMEGEEEKTHWLQVYGEEEKTHWLQGEEEKTHWLQVYENQSKVRQQKKKMKNTTFQGKKTRLDSDGEGSDGETQQKMEDTTSAAKRPHEDSGKDEEPAKKHVKTEGD